MKRLLLALICASSINAFCQEETGNYKKFSSGVYTSIGFYDIGVYGSYHHKRHTLRLFATYSTRIYPKNITSGSSKGYGLGGGYLFELGNFEESKIYRPKLITSYFYKNITGTDYFEGGGGYEIKFDGDYFSHQINLGYVNSFNFNNFDLQITPYFVKYYDILKGYNIQETQDLYNVKETPLEEEVIPRSWNYLLYMEISIGYRF